jgi:TolB-like protein
LAKFLHVETDALPTESLTENQIAGTLPYMAPEQVRGDHVDIRSDIYGAGAVLYEMATGRRPFSETNPISLIDAILHREPPRPTAINQHVSTHLENVILRTLSRDPESRHQTALELAADLAGLSASQTHGVQKKTVSGRKSLRVGLRPGAVVLAALGVLIALIFAIPSVHHLLFRSEGSESQASRNGGGDAVSLVSGLPPLSAGRYVAVLPFRTVGDAPSLDVVAEELNEALTSKLSRFKQLHLASDTDVAKSPSSESLERVARSLGVNLIVNGIVQGGVDKMSISVNLRDVVDSRIKLWTQQFSGVPGDLLTLEGQISGQLATALDLYPTKEELALATALDPYPTKEEMAFSSAHPTENVAAYELYLRGRRAMRKQQEVKNDQIAADFFEKATQKDQYFARAYSGLADASLAIYLSKKDEFWWVRALAAAQQAQRLNDNAAEVHLSLGEVYHAVGNTTQAIAELQRAVKLEPNSDDYYRALGDVYMSASRSPEAIASYQKAISLNPYFWLNYNAIGKAYLSLGDTDKADAAFAKVNEIVPDN